jgi:hypothetical protein
MLCARAAPLPLRAKNMNLNRRYLITNRPHTLPEIFANFYERFLRFLRGLIHLGANASRNRRGIAGLVALKIST